MRAAAPGPPAGTPARAEAATEDKPSAQGPVAARVETRSQPLGDGEIVRASAPRHPLLALVLSGGGARGAYEAGVLSYLLEELPRRLGRPPRFDILTGTSVGGIHACFLAATLGRPGAGLELRQTWRSITAEGVYQLGATQLIDIPLRLLGLRGPAARSKASRPPERIPGILDTSRLERLVVGRIPWRAIARNISSGTLTALAVTATEISTGCSVVFVDNREGAVRHWARDPFVVARPVRIGPLHALASAAIPFLFPAPRIGESYYCDGGLRLNTPLAPALRLGAERVLVIGLRHLPTSEEQAALARSRETSYGTLAYVAGKVLNALLLDHVDYDVDRLRLVNGILETGIKAYGEGFLARINETITALRGTEYRVVRDLYIRPSQDLSVIAATCLDHPRPRRGIRARLSDSVFRYAARGAIAEADLLSYIFFDPCYVEHLAELGWHDAEAASDELVEFFREG